MLYCNGPVNLHSALHYEHHTFPSLDLMQSSGCREHLLLQIVILKRALYWDVSKHYEIALYVSKNMF